MAAINIDTPQFQAEVLESDKFVLVDFWAPWCPPCRAMAPVLDELSEDAILSPELNIRKINTDEPQNQFLAQALQINSIPNMKLFYKGKIVEDFVGFRPIHLFKAELKEAIAANKAA